MSLITTLTITLALLVNLLNAQSTSIAASQSTDISSALSAYTSSLLHGPVATSLALAVAFDIPATQLSSLASNVASLVPFPTTDQYSYATAPPITDLSNPAWASTLPADVQSDLQSLRTSVILAEASIVRSVLGITGGTPSVANSSGASAFTTSSSTGSSGGVTVGGKDGVLISVSAALMVLLLIRSI